MERARRVQELLQRFPSDVAEQCGLVLYKLFFYVQWEAIILMDAVCWFD
jgi:hypothetical protein